MTKKGIYEFIQYLMVHQIQYTVNEDVILDWKLEELDDDYTSFSLKLHSIYRDKETTYMMHVPVDKKEKKRFLDTSLWDICDQIVEDYNYYKEPERKLLQ